MRQKKGAKVKESKSSEVQKLKNRIKKLEKEKRDLISKLNTAEKALKQNMKFQKGMTEDVTLEDLLEAAKNNKSYKQMEDDLKNCCPKCGELLTKISTNFGLIETCYCGFRKKTNE